MIEGIEMRYEFMIVEPCFGSGHLHCVGLVNGLWNRFFEGAFTDEVMERALWVTAVNALGGTSKEQALNGWYA